jgi:hypothetical protein
MIDCYKETEAGMFFSSDPESLTSLERWLDEFVDDAELGLYDFWDECPALQDMDFEGAAQKWERLLFTSGGALELSRYLWYCLHWYWDADGREQATIFDKQALRQTGPTLDLTRGMNKKETTAIKRLEVTASHKTLGVRLEPIQ